MFFDTFLNKALFGAKMNLKPYGGSRQMNEPVRPISYTPLNTKTPRRIQTLLWSCSQGQQVTCHPDLQIVPNEFFSEGRWHQKN
jgi:hypothetical protein